MRLESQQKRIYQAISKFITLYFTNQSPKDKWQGYNELFTKLFNIPADRVLDTHPDISNDPDLLFLNHYLEKLSREADGAQGAEFREIIFDCMKKDYPPKLGGDLMEHLHTAITQDSANHLAQFIYHFELLCKQSSLIDLSNYYHVLVPACKRAASVYIDAYNPEFIFTKAIENNVFLPQIGQLITSLPHKVKICFKDCELGQIDFASRPQFLNVVKRATSLQLLMNKSNTISHWTADDFDAFVSTIEQNKDLVQLTIKDSSLSLFAEHSIKWHTLLRLIALPQLKKIDLSNCGLATLSEPYKAELAELISKHKDKQIMLRATITPISQYPNPFFPKESIAESVTEDSQPYFETGFVN